MPFSSLRPLFLQPCARILTRLPVVLAGIINQYTLPRAPPPPPSSLISLFLILPPPHGPANHLDPSYTRRRPSFLHFCITLPLTTPTITDGRPACANPTPLTLEPVRSFDQTKPNGIYYSTTILI